MSDLTDEFNRIMRALDARGSDKRVTPDNLVSFRMACGCRMVLGFGIYRCARHL